MSDPADRIRAELRHAADAYVPDRAAIAQRAAVRRVAAARRDRMRPALAAAAVVTVALGGVIGIRLNEDPRREPSAPVAAPARSAGASQRVPSENPNPDKTEPAAKPKTRPATRTPGTTRPQATKPALVEVAGVVDKASVATWTQNTVTLKVDEPAWVEVKVTVAKSRDAKRAGWFSTVPNSDLTFTAQDTGDALLYTYTLKEGVKLRAGTYVFAAQFSHGSGRGAGGDSFEVDARVGADDATESGDFTKT